MSFDQNHEDEKAIAAFEAHVQRKKYGDFVLTDAVRPSMELEVIPRQGFRRSIRRCGQHQTRISVVKICASEEVLFPLFRDLLDLMPEEIDVVLESSHSMPCNAHAEYWRYSIDRLIFESIALGFEDLLVNDGCTGVAVVTLPKQRPLEIYFDNHKILTLYGFKRIARLSRILRNHNVPCIPDLRFITDTEHFHSTSDDYALQFSQFAQELGAGE